MATVDLNDTRLTNITNEKNNMLSQTENQYNQMINNVDTTYQNQIQSTKDWEAKQTELQQANTDFAIEQINQQKDQAGKDYTKEQKGAYQDYMKQSNAYGSNMQQSGQAGLAKSGWSETMKGSFYNTYQNRYATAKETYNKATLNYDNAIKDAILQNNSALAQIAYESQAKQLELATSNMQYKNQLLQQKTNAQLSINEMYNSNWKSMYDTLLKQEQFNEEQKLARDQLKEKQRQYNEELALQRLALAKQGTSSIGSSVSSAINSVSSTTKSSNSIKKDNASTTKKTTNTSGKNYSSKDYIELSTTLDRIYNDNTGNLLGAGALSYSNKRNQLKSKITEYFNSGKITTAEAVALAEKYKL